MARPVREGHAGDQNIRGVDSDLRPVGHSTALCRHQQTLTAAGRLHPRGWKMTRMPLLQIAFQSKLVRVVVVHLSGRVWATLDDGLTRASRPATPPWVRAPIITDEGTNRSCMHPPDYWHQGTGAVHCMLHLTCNGHPKDSACSAWHGGRASDFAQPICQRKPSRCVQGQALR